MRLLNQAMKRVVSMVIRLKGDGSGHYHNNVSMSSKQLSVKVIYVSFKKKKVSTQYEEHPTYLSSRRSRLPSLSS